MRDPEKPNETWKAVPSTKEPIPVGDRECFKWYFKQSEAIKNAHGMGMQKGKLVVTNQAKLDGCSPERKEILRELWKEFNPTPRDL